MTSPGRSESDPALVRVGDTERNSALEALGAHLTAGRLDMDEYGERSAVVTTARTVADLQAVFQDLPAPHPVLPGGAVVPRPVGSSPTPWAAAAPAPPAVPESGSVTRNTGQKAVALITGLSVPLALILFFVLMTVGVGQAWLAFLLIPVAGVVANVVQRPGGR